MKKIFILLCLVVLFSGGTTISKKNTNPNTMAVEQLEEISATLDTTSLQFDKSFHAIQNLR